MSAFAMSGSSVVLCSKYIEGPVAILEFLHHLYIQQLRISMRNKQKMKETSIVGIMLLISLAKTCIGIISDINFMLNNVGLEAHRTVKKEKARYDGPIRQCGHLT